MKSRKLTKDEFEDYLRKVGYYSNTSMSFEEATLLITRMLAEPDYSCMRPPGAAGAMFVSMRFNSEAHRKILGVVEPPVGDTCKEVGECEMENGHCVRTIHAEVNAILVAVRNGIPTNKGTIYSLLKPCYQCTKAIIAAGISQIYYAGKAYDEERTQKLLELSGVKCIHVNIGLEYGNG